MLTPITPEAVIEAFGPTSLTYFPRAVPGHLHGPTAGFLASVGIPESKFFGPRTDLENDSAQRLRSGPSLKASFEQVGSELPPKAKSWEKLGDFVYAAVALDPRDGRVYVFPEGGSDYQLMHADVSSLHALIVLNRGRADFMRLGPDDDEQRAQIVDRMTQEITAVDPTTPFTDEEGEWETLFDQIRLTMWR
ncbi:SUKH-4 family immunity protein [Streptomyces niveus]|uniref:SUKH-4 family immunity protein n=1 Tax=Streptomyces niveus TaxID=193462 RepID=UPI00363C333D